MEMKQRQHWSSLVVVLELGGRGKMRGGVVNSSVGHLLL
jgi:hypothetical protein